MSANREDHLLTTEDFATEDLATEDLDALREEVASLRISKTVFEMQTALLKNATALARTTSGSLILKAILQQTLQMVVELTAAEDSSLFLLNSQGQVMESILARGPVIRDLKQTLIGKVLDDGLAGWVFRSRQVGLIPDTIQDERWLQLPHQPYAVRSALGIPLIRGRQLLGIITLMHSQAHYFSTDHSDLMTVCAEHITLVLEQILLFTNPQLLEVSAPATKTPTS